MKGLLSVCFGTSYAATREKTIDAVEARLREAFPDRAFFSGWTSGRVVAKLREERGEVHDTLDEALERAGAEGVDDLLVSTMCLMDGHETAKIEAAVEAWVQSAPGRSARVARSLLHGVDDRRAMAQAVVDEFADLPEGEGLLLMGHGQRKSLSVHAGGQGGDPNAVFSQIQREFHALGRPRFFMGTVEGAPTFEDAVSMLERDGVEVVNLAPFMIVAGDHATNDLAGDDDGSWKSMLEARGMRTRVVLRGLGEYAGVQQLVCDHARAAEAGEARCGE